jgi:hypothetical protein
MRFRHPCLIRVQSVASILFQIEILFMSNVERFTSGSNEPGSAVPDVLNQLRRRIRRYVLLEGSALVLVVLGCAFWISLAVDYWFEPATGNMVTSTWYREKVHPWVDEFNRARGVDRRRVRHRSREPVRG